MNSIRVPPNTCSARANGASEERDHAGFNDGERPHERGREQSCEGRVGQLASKRTALRYVTMSWSGFLVLLVA